MRPARAASARRDPPNAFILRFVGSEGLFVFALVSQPLTRSAIFRGVNERSVYVENVCIGAGFGRLFCLPLRSRAVRGRGHFLCSGNWFQCGLHESGRGAWRAVADHTRHVWRAGGSVRSAVPSQPTGFHRRRRLVDRQIQQAGARSPAKSLWHRFHHLRQRRIHHHERSRSKHIRLDWNPGHGRFTSWRKPRRQPRLGQP